MRVSDFSLGRYRHVLRDQREPCFLACAQFFRAARPAVVRVLPRKGKRCHPCGLGFSRQCPAPPHRSLHPPFRHLVYPLAASQIPAATAMAAATPIEIHTHQRRERFWFFVPEFGRADPPSISFITGGGAGLTLDPVSSAVPLMASFRRSTPSRLYRIPLRERSPLPYPFHRHSSGQGTASVGNPLFPLSGLFSSARNRASGRVSTCADRSVQWFRPQAARSHTRRAFADPAAHGGCD